MWFLTLLALAGAAEARARRPADEVDVAERMHTEFDAAGGVVAPSDLGSFAHAAGLAPELADALTDIMAALQHGSDSSREDAIAQLVQLSVETAEADREQATLFRSAVVAGGALPELVAMLGEAEPWRQALAAAAVHALAVDDPTTDDDNFHSLAICEAGAVAPLVRLLGVDSEEVQVRLGWKSVWRVPLSIRSEGVQPAGNTCGTVGVGLSLTLRRIREDERVGMWCWLGGLRLKRSHACQPRASPTHTCPMPAPLCSTPTGIPHHPSWPNPPASSLVLSPSPVFPRRRPLALWPSWPRTRYVSR